MSGPIISYGLAQDIVARYAKSGYPDAPVVPEPPPRLRRTRLRTARVLAWAARQASGLAERLAPVEPGCVATDQ